MTTAIIPSGTIYEPRSYDSKTRLQSTPGTPTPQAFRQTSQQNQQAETTEKKKKKELRHVVGVIVIDPSTKRVLMLSSRKREDAYVLPKGDCLVESEKRENYEDAAFRILYEAGVKANSLSRRIGVYTEANKRGKIIAHHAMFEVTSFALLQPPHNYDRTRVWVNYDVALEATVERPMSLLALRNSSLRQ